MRGQLGCAEVIGHSRWLYLRQTGAYPVGSNTPEGVLMVLTGFPGTCTPWEFYADRAPERVVAVRGLGCAPYPHRTSIPGVPKREGIAESQVKKVSSEREVFCSRQVFPMSGCRKRLVASRRSQHRWRIGVRHAQRPATNTELQVRAGTQVGDSLGVRYVRWGKVVRRVSLGLR